MSSLSPPLSPRPEPPDAADCCGSGCARCVYDVYEEALAEWQRLSAQSAPEGLAPADASGYVASSPAEPCDT